MTHDEAAVLLACFLLAGIAFAAYKLAVKPRERVWVPPKQWSPKRVFVSGCFEIIHGGHLQFFSDARALGGYLTVCFACDETIRAYKHREPCIPEEHRRMLLQALRMVDDVVMGDALEEKQIKPWLDFVGPLIRSGSEILVVTTDDPHVDEKIQIGKDFGFSVVVLEKTPPTIQPVSTTDIRQRVLHP